MAPLVVSSGGGLQLNLTSGAPFTTVWLKSLGEALGTMEVYRYNYTHVVFSKQHFNVVNIFTYI